MREMRFLWKFDGGEAPVIYRAGAEGDLAVLRQVFRAQEYRTDLWPQGLALRAFLDAEG